MEAIFSLVGFSQSARSETSGMFSGQQVFSRMAGAVDTTWTLFLKHLAALASDRVSCLLVVTACDSAMDATGGEYKINYKGVMRLIVEDTVAAFVEVGLRMDCQPGEGAASVREHHPGADSTPEAGRAGDREHLHAAGEDLSVGGRWGSC